VSHRSRRSQRDRKQRRYTAECKVHWQAQSHAGMHAELRHAREDTAECCSRGLGGIVCSRLRVCTLYLQAEGWQCDVATAGQMDLSSDDVAGPRQRRQLDNILLHTGSFVYTAVHHSNRHPALRHPVHYHSVHTHPPTTIYPTQHPRPKQYLTAPVQTMKQLQSYIDAIQGPMPPINKIEWL
jgi:hypothetical protein